MKPVRVLVVDDSLTIRAMIEDVLANDPEIQVVGLAADAEQAWDLMKTARPDVLTLDITMPGLDGMRFLSDIMARRPTPVVMVSGSMQPGSQEHDEAMRRGAAACFGKGHILTQAKTLTTMVKRAGRARAQSRQVSWKM